MKKSDKKGFNILATVALGALGAYFLYGTKEGESKIAKIKGWMLKMKGEVLEEIESLKELNEETYTAVVNSASKRYKALKNVDNKELEKVVKDLKKHWKDIKKKLTK